MSYNLWEHLFNLCQTRASFQKFALTFSTMVTCMSWLLYSFALLIHLVMRKLNAICSHLPYAHMRIIEKRGRMHIVHLSFRAWNAFVSTGINQQNRERKTLFQRYFSIFPHFFSKKFVNFTLQHNLITCCGFVVIMLLFNGSTVKWIFNMKFFHRDCVKVFQQFSTFFLH